MIYHVLCSQKYVCVCASMLTKQPQYYVVETGLGVLGVHVHRGELAVADFHNDIVLSNAASHSGLRRSDAQHGQRPREYGGQKVGAAVLCLFRVTWRSPSTSGDLWSCIRRWRRLWHALKLSYDHLLCVKPALGHKWNKYDAISHRAQVCCHRHDRLHVLASRHNGENRCPRRFAQNTYTQQT